MKQILVTGATGRVGGQVASQLLSKNVRVRALSRNPAAAGLPADVEVAQGDFTAPNTLDGAVDNIDTVFLVWTAPGNTAPDAINTIAQHARKIVFLSSPHQTPHPLFQQPNPLATLHANIERLIRVSGMKWTFLRPGMFSSNALLWWAPQIRSGDVVRWPYGSAPTAPIDERDIAAVAARVLMEDGHEGTDYVLTGPESLTQLEQVKTISEVIGRSLRFEELSPEDARRELPFPSSAINMLLDAWDAAVGQPAYVTSTVSSITGKPARTFREWVIDHRDAFRAEG